MSALRRHEKKRRREWSYLLPNLGESLRLASVLAVGTQVRGHFCRCHWGMGGVQVVLDDAWLPTTDGGS